MLREPTSPEVPGGGRGGGMFKLNRPLSRLGLGYLGQGSRPQFPTIVIYLQKTPDTRYVLLVAD